MSSVFGIPSIPIRTKLNAITPLSPDEHFYLQGLEPTMTYQGQRWLRLASLYPETIDYVDFYHNGNLIYTAYDEPFSVNFKSNWRQGAVDIGQDDGVWRAVIHLRNGDVIDKHGTSGI